MMTFLNWLTALLVATLCLVNLLLIWTRHRETIRWMRVFSIKQGVTLSSMEGEKQQPKEVVRVPDTRKRISIPVPGSQMFKSN